MKKKNTVFRWLLVLFVCSTALGAERLLVQRRSAVPAIIKLICLFNVYISGAVAVFAFLTEDFSFAFAVSAFLLS